MSLYTAEFAKVKSVQIQVHEGKQKLLLDEVTDEDLAVNIQDELGGLLVDREATARRVTFGRKLHYLLANLTTESARLTARQNYESFGFETWRRLVKKYSLPDATRHVSLLTQLLDFKFNPQNFEQDFNTWEISR